MEFEDLQKVFPKLKVDSEYIQDCFAFRDNSKKDASRNLDSDIDVYFRNLEDHLVRHIRQSGVVLGCVSWLTSPTILDALASTMSCLVVQKESYLKKLHKPDNEWTRELREKYERILYNWKYPRYSMYDDVLRYMEHESRSLAEQTTWGIRCVGHWSSTPSEKYQNIPRMHNKFLIFCDGGKFCHKDEEGNKICEDLKPIKPKAVWTGSFNFTSNASRSLENAVVIKDYSIAKRYYKEFCQIMAISEPLDWTSDRANPEWYIDFSMP